MFATANVNSFSQPPPESGKEGETNPNLPVRGTFGREIINCLNKPKASIKTVNKNQ
jgi:hypothetical protein